MEFIDPGATVNVQLSTDGQRLWICTPEQGTIVRVKCKRINLVDLRLDRSLDAPPEDYDG